ncbi:MAG TPA: hypothetical protein VGD43_08795, partial [Micromonospora sp.]
MPAISLDQLDRELGELAAAPARAEQDCRIAMDLPGPKLRTGPLTPGPAVLRLRPVRDELG